MSATTSAPSSPNLDALPRHSVGNVRIALVDRDSGFLTVLRRRSSTLGWEQRELTSIPSIDALVEMRLHLLIVDIALLGPQWAEAIEYTRVNLPELGLVICTGTSSVGQRVRGLRAGADDWLTKPCHPEELIARGEAVLRRRRPARALVREPVLAGEIAVRPDQFQAFCSGESMDLTRREFELLHLLSDNEGQVIERDEIYQRVWGYQMAHGDRSVDVFVRKLRHKLAQVSPTWTYIHTHFGVGYRFAPRIGKPEDDLKKSGKSEKGAAKQAARASAAK
ncbi:MAG: response regulator transcription factor [Solirubrobacterales bacterium]|nr:response regulator transcription factor [Solirubrobacterales bacterium]